MEQECCHSTHHRTRARFTFFSLHFQQGRTPPHCIRDRFRDGKICFVHNIENAPQGGRASERASCSTCRKGARSLGLENHTSITSTARVQRRCINRHLFSVCTRLDWTGVQRYNRFFLSRFSLFPLCRNQNMARQLLQINIPDPLASLATAHGVPSVSGSLQLWISEPPPTTTLRIRGGLALGHTGIGPQVSLSLSLSL